MIRMPSTLFLVAVGLCGVDSSAQCPHRFAGIFQGTGTESPPPGGGVAMASVLTSFIDAGKNTVFIGGQFSRMGGVEVNKIASWDGSLFGAVGIGPQGSVTAMTHFDDGTGDALYAVFPTSLPITPGFPGVFRRAGTTWTQLGSLTAFIQKLVVADDGTGDALFALGTPHASLPTGISKWTGSTWLPVGGVLPCAASTTSVTVTDLVRFDDGSGATLWASTRCGPSVFPPIPTGTPTLLKLVANTWVGMNQGLLGPINDLDVFDSGQGPELYAAGFFSPSIASNCAKMVGLGWAPLGAISNVPFNRITFWDDGQGAALFAGVSAPIGLLKLAGAAWTPVGSGVVGVVSDVTVADDGRGPALFFAGQFDTTSSGQLLNNVGRWDGTSISALTGQGLDKGILSLAECTVAGQKSLYAGGVFRHVGSAAADRIARFDGSSWSPLGAGITGANPGSAAEVDAIAEFNDGTGPAVYAAGSFAMAGGTSAANIARWNGTSWAPLGSGTNGPVYALAVFNSGQGPRLYAAGSFNLAGGVNVSNIAVWNGSSWSPAGLSSANGTNGPIFALKVLGTKLIAGGSFTLAGSASAAKVASWNGTTWAAVGSGLGNGTVYALETYPNTASGELWAGGASLFSSTSGPNLTTLAIWNGLTWSPVMSGPQNTVGALKAFNDGSGPAMYAGGFFTSVDSGSVATGHIARYQSGQWSSLGSGIPASSNVSAVYALAIADHGAGTALYIGGDFLITNSNGSSRLARWERDPSSPACAVLAEPAASGSFGSAVGGPFNILTVNGSTGQGHRVNIGVGQPFSMTIMQPLAPPFTSTFAIFGYFGIPTASEAILLAPGFGSMVFTPCPLDPSNPQLFVVADGFGLPGCTAVLGTNPAPWTYHLPSGIAVPITATFQGIIVDATATYGVSISNAIAVIVDP